MKKDLLVFGAIISLALVACASKQDNLCLRRAAAGEIAITQSLDMTVNLYSAGKISPQSAGDALAAIRSANSLVDSAGRLCVVDDVKAAGLLQEASVIFDEIKDILGERV